jgi:hypothetical protein
VIRRRLFNIASAVSLLLCVATAVLWARSYAVVYSEIRQRLRVQGQQTEMDTSILRVRDGSIYFHREVIHEPFKLVTHINPNAEKQLLESAGGDYFIKQSPSQGASGRNYRDGCHLPLPIVCTVFAIAPLMWFRLKRYRFTGPGRCPTCNYDLTANTSGTCPECGTPVPSKPEGIA